MGRLAQCSLSKVAEGDGAGFLPDGWESLHNEEIWGLSRNVPFDSARADCACQVKLSARKQRGTQTGGGLPSAPSNKAAATPP